jgi:hypothetical protein
VSKFRKKPVVIEAVQLTWANWSEVCDFVSKEAFGGGCYVAPDGAETNDCNGRIGLHIKTLEGTMLAGENDWVIRGIKGEFYPCKPDIFAATYEPATDDDPLRAEGRREGLREAAAHLRTRADDYEGHVTMWDGVADRYRELAGELDTLDAALAAGTEATTKGATE